MTELELLKSAVLPRCPSCGDSNPYSNGHRYSYGLEIQRFKCRVCGYRFSDPASKTLNVNPDNVLDSQQNFLCKEIDLLAALEQKESGAGINATQQGLIVEYQWKMQKRQLANL